MTLQKISREEFHTRTKGAFANPPLVRAGIATERGWFRHGADFLGLVLLDNIDRDFSWVTFKRRRQVYRAAGLGVSRPSFAEAVAAIEQARGRR